MGVGYRMAIIEPVVLRTANEFLFKGKGDNDPLEPITNLHGESNSLQIVNITKGEKVFVPKHAF